MTSLVEPERINTGRALRFAARPSRLAPRIQKDNRRSRRDSSSGLVTPSDRSASRRGRVISRQSPQRLALGDLA
jgi:hypothetical protein